MKEWLPTYHRPPGFALVTPPAEQQRPAVAPPEKSSPQRGVKARVFKLDRREEICVWCVNRNREGCGPCRLEGAHSCLEPDTLAIGEQGPELPPYRELRQWPAEARLAMIYIVIYYATLRI